MATININENETINVELGEQSSSLNTTLKDINYIPSYKEAETERRTNEIQRITNENDREEYIDDLKNRVSNGEFNGKDGKDGAIQYTAGKGIKIENNVISATGGGSSGGGTWGSIEGNLSDQTDLQEALNDKANKGDIPTKLSDLNNDSGFITKTVDNLTNYYKKSEIYTQQEVNTLISNVNSFNVEVVQTLPVDNIDTHTIYLVPKKAETNDNYDEYIYINNSWEHIGSTSVDLTNYYNKTEIDTKLESKANATDLESKQDNLVSGTNVKTINNESILGSGNIDLTRIPVSATPPEEPQENDLWIDTSEDGLLAKVDQEVSDTSSNAVSNKAITNYVNGLNTYSTNETVIGKWYDGKPLYRKVLTGVTSTSTGWDNIAKVGTEIKIKKITGMASGYLPIPYYITSEYYIAVQYNISNGYLQSNTRGYTNIPLEITIEYTKTTDIVEQSEEV